MPDDLIKDVDKIEVLSNLVKYAIRELREWNPESESANDIEEILNWVMKK